MMLFFHIVVAVGCLISAVLLFVNPTKRILMATYGLTTAMLASGTLLVLSSPGHLLKACVMGLSLMCIVLYSIVRANNNLSIETAATRSTTRK